MYQALKLDISFAEQFSALKSTTVLNLQTDRHLLAGLGSNGIHVWLYVIRIQQSSNCNLLQLYHKTKYSDYSYIL